MQIVKAAASKIEIPGSEDQQHFGKRLRYALFRVFQMERFQDLVDSHKKMVSALYEEMGAGTTFQASASDFPERRYRFS
jgi:hypothetical protein